MSAIPLEILTITFKHLETTTLTQCQLVCKSWNGASIKLLYSNITMNNESVIYRYVRTINGSPQLGKYLEVVKTGSVLKKDDESEKWDTYNLLETIIKYCPNLLELHFDETSSILWTKLMFAASQDRLSFLRYITCPWNNDFDLYVYTVLVFKKTINHLELPDLYNGIQNLYESEAYPILEKSLNQFPCLQILTISYETGRSISYFDGLIDDCRFLTKLSLVSPINEKDEERKEPLFSIKPHLSIHTLKCKWDFVNTDYQMVYVMHKFPNLKSLNLVSDDYYDGYVKEISSDVWISFSNFAANLPNFAFNIVANEEELNTVWANFIYTKYKNLTVKVKVTSNLESENSVELKLISNRLELFFSPYCIGFYFTKFLFKIGNNIRSLFIENKNYSGDVFDSAERIVEIIRCCPSAQHITLSYFNSLPFSKDTTYQHPEVKILSLLMCEYSGYRGILNNMTSILPNLKTVILNDENVRSDKSGTLQIDMPNASLDILKWDILKPDFTSNYIFETYIRLKTNSGERFYMTFEKNLTSTTLIQYNYSRSNRVYLDITCKKLAKIGINGVTYTM